MDTRLKDNEWIILHAVWQENPIDLKSIIRYVQAHNPEVTWDYKTYHSFLRILLDKGYLKAVKVGMKHPRQNGILDRNKKE